MYARGMTTRDIQGHLEEMYGVEVSPALISEVTDGVMEEVKAWQSRPLEPIYPIVYLDALMVKMRHEGRVENRAVFVGIGVNLEGAKEVLGLWTSATEGAKFWLQILTEIRNRGVNDVLIACVDGLKGFPEAIQSVYPKDAGATLHRAYGAKQPELRELERAESSGGGFEDGLPRGHGRGGRTATGRFRRAVGRKVPFDWKDVAAQLGGNRALLCLPSGDPESSLHDEYRGVAEYEPAEGNQNAGLLSGGRSGAEAAVPGSKKRR